MTVDMMEVEVHEMVSAGLPTEINKTELRAMPAAVRHAALDDAAVFVQEEDNTKSGKTTLQMVGQQKH